MLARGTVGKNPRQKNSNLFFEQLMEHFETRRASGLNDLSDPLLGIYNRNYHDRKSLFYRRPER